MTAPTMNKFEADVVKPQDRSHPFVLTNEIDVEHLVSLLQEFLAEGALPAL
jgi:hypothetical protein